MKNRFVKRSVQLYPIHSFYIWIVVFFFDRCQCRISNYRFFLLQLAVSHETPKEIAGEDYHVFYPVTIGKNHVDFIYSNRFASAADQELYETLNKNGSILVNVSDYLNEENEQFGRGIK